MSNTVGWNAWGTWSFLCAFAIYTKSARSYVNERLFVDSFGETAWNWDTDSKSKANNLLHAVSNFEFIITQITTMKCLSILKPLSIKLQKRDIDVYEAYNHIKD